MGGEVDRLIERMAALQAELSADGDPGRYFLGTYLRITQAVRGALDDGLFEDPAWLERWDVDFAGLYLDALEAYRRDPATAPEPWRRAFGADPGLRPEGHVLLGVNAHINFDLPQSLVRVIPDEEFADPAALARRERDHERIDGVLASRVAAEDVELQRAGDPRTLVDHVLGPLNRTATRLFLREARRKVWANTAVLHRARLAGEAEHRRRVAELEALSAARISDLLRPGPVLLRLAVRGFGVTLPA
ncbi:DUF5995 family protein [Geodermatophilus sp. URMC 64]